MWWSWHNKLLSQTFQHSITIKTLIARLIPKPPRVMACPKLRRLSKTIRKNATLHSWPAARSSLQGPDVSAWKTLPTSKTIARIRGQFLKDFSRIFEMIALLEHFQIEFDCLGKAKDFPNLIVAMNHWTIPNFMALVIILYNSTDLTDHQLLMNVR
jgi:hypothetical protein